MNYLLTDVFIYEKWLLLILIWRLCRAFNWINWWNETYAALLSVKMMRFLTFLMKSNWITDVINLLLLAGAFRINRFLFERLSHAYLTHSPFPIICLLALRRLLHILSYIIQSNSTRVMRFVVVVILGYHLILWLLLLLLLLWITQHLAGSLLYNLSYPTGVVCTTCAATLSNKTSELTTSLVLCWVILWRGSQRTNGVGSCLSASLII